MPRSFIRSESGNMSVVFAVTLPAILGGVGLAIDTGNLMNAKAQLQNAADVGVLVASREGVSDEQRQGLFDRYLQTNLARSNMRVAESKIEMESGVNHLGVTGRVTAEVDLFFMQHLGIGRVSVEASTFRSTKSMEIAVVLDNTGSMGSSGINALKKASHALVKAVEDARAPGQDVRMALVPFVTAVNIKHEGFSNWEWIDEHGRALYNGWNFLDHDQRNQRRLRADGLPDGYSRYRDQDPPASAPGGGNSQGSGNGQGNGNGNNAGVGRACNNQGQGRPAIEMRERCREDALTVYPDHFHLLEQAFQQDPRVVWKGCVEARPFVRGKPASWWLEPPDPRNPDSLFVPYFAPDEPGTRMAQGGNDARKFNNSWLDDVIGLSPSRQNNPLIIRSTLKYMDPDVAPANQMVGPLTLGPNRACPTPVVPLTENFAKIRAGIDAMKYWNGSGTNIAEGLVWGWRILSPEAPFTQAGRFDDEERRKFMVLMTDGTNVSYGARDEVTESDYGSYNFLSNRLIDGATTQGNAETKLNEWTADMCREMKAQGVEVFTVIYNETSPVVRNLFTACATTPDHFYMTNNTAALEAAFASIGNRMSKLRLTN